jgi:hypothetical protein
MIEENLKRLKNISILTSNLIIFGVSILFAFWVLLETVTSRGWIFIIFSIPFILVNLFFSKKFPDRFHKWFKYDKHYYRPVSRPPLSITAMSIALTVFIFHLFYSPAAEIWHSSLENLPSVMTAVGTYVILFIFSFIFFIVSMYIFIIIFERLVKLFNISHKTSHRYSPLFLVGFLFLSEVLFLKTIGLPIIEVVLLNIYQIAVFVVGFIPIHWVYEIFVGSLLKDKKEKKSESNI